MAEECIITGNRLIAEFMGIGFDNEGGRFYNFPSDKMYNDGEFSSVNTFGTAEELIYHESWDWLMPVVEKISRMKIGDGTEYVEYAYPRTFGMVNGDGKFMFRLNGMGLHTDVDPKKAVFLGVVEFVKRYNKNVSAGDGGKK